MNVTCARHPAGEQTCGWCCAAVAMTQTEALRAENERLRMVIRTGGAMYRAERATMGIPAGHDPYPGDPRPPSESEGEDPK